MPPAGPAPAQWWRRWGSHASRWRRGRRAGPSPANATPIEASRLDEREDALVDLVGLLDLHEVAGPLDDRHLGTGGQQIAGTAGDIKTDAAVGRAVQIQRRLRRDLTSGRLRGGQLGRRLRPAERG